MPPTTTPSAAVIEANQIAQDNGVMRARAERALRPMAAADREPVQPLVQADAEHDDHHDAKQDRLDQHRPERRREHLLQRLDGGVEHGGIPVGEIPKGQR